jgi:hypothetical protein
MTIGPKELASFPYPLALGTPAPVPPFSDELLTQCESTHVLVFTPASYADGTPITLNSLREKFGTDPAVREPCFYNQDWYVKEEFATRTALDGRWHLLRKEVLEEMRAKRPEEIEKELSSDEGFPTAVTCAFAFLAYWVVTGEKLWTHDFLWCSDRDHNGDRVYVGRYEDPSGVNKNGFNIHRHLALRPSYSAAPELLR